MIETTIPEINVSDLMERVRAKVSEAAKKNKRDLSVAAGQQNPAIVLPETVPPPPPLALPHPPPARKERVLSLLGRARETTAVSRWVPKPLRRLFRKQGGYNRALLESVSVLAKANAELAGRLEQLTACVKVEHDWLGETHEKSAGNLIAASRRSDILVERINSVRQDLQRQFDAADAQVGANISGFREQLTEISRSLQSSHEELLKDLKRLGADGGRNAEHLRNLQKEVEELRGGGQGSAEQIRALQREIERHAAAAAALQESQQDFFKEFQNVRVDEERSAEHLRNLQKETDRNTAAQAALDSMVAELLGGFRALRTDGEHVGVHLRNLQNTVTQNERLTESMQQRLEWLEARQAELTRTYDRLDERFASEAAFLRAQLSGQSSQIQRWITSTGIFKEPDFIAEAAIEATGNRFDAFYLQFENRFRGSRNEIKERISFYLPYVWETRAGSGGHPLLDLGCGRGEWLELLRDSGMEALGIDINSAMLDLCRQRGLHVVNADALEYLRSLPDNSQGAVTGFHIIEHLPFTVLMDVFTEVQRVVEPGGFVIFESPNCKNLIVGACNFNVDPTHRNPVFPDTAKFMLDILGFQPVELEYLTPMAKTPFDVDKSVHPVLKDLLYGPQDFAVIGYKATSA